MAYEAISGKPLRFPPGRVRIRLGPEHRSAYRTLYAHYQSVLAGLPVLRERDFDGRPVTVTADELEALNREFARLAETSKTPDEAFSGQEAARTALFKRLQFLS